MYGIRFAENVEQDLMEISPYHRKRILTAIAEQLSREPTVQTRNRKVLQNLVPPWEAIPPIWELRAGDYRVFYDVSKEERVVYVRAVRRKPAGKKTEAIL